ncbi:flagellar filament capping protein FliD [Cohnella cholangitidis]|uniref:Flagellar hook-associated protein 2 n=1 Tax=Cohnella cholangitidis TaxID=2598458 RepID=A0A7G5BXJ3_9BACL|nr:flagellar filament capping protein FliD [Cohnella cholangitidis]QMV41677.1 flagellar hook-associated 2 domain-containing protein [Cohnella cholangitidis]
MSGISLNGLASGLNTGEMIEALMKLERIPYDKLTTKKSTLSEEQGLIRSINTKLVTLRSAVSDLMYSTSYNLTSAKASDSTVFSVSSTDQATTGSYNVNVTKLAKKHVVSSGEFLKTGSDLTAGDKFQLFGNGSATGTEITLKGANNQEILNNLKNDINIAKKGVTASIVETTPGNQTLVLTTDKFGTDSDIQLGTMPATPDGHVYIDGPDALLKTLGIKKADNSLNTRQSSQDAVAEVNGITITSSSNELKDVIPGVTINLLKDNASSTITVTSDTDKIAAKIQTFVDAYNDAITAVRSNSAKEAKMQGDSTLRTLQSELNDLVNGEVKGAGAYKFLFEVGLEIDKGITSGAEMTGKLSFDKSKFVAAYTKDPQAVADLFGSNAAKENKNKGVATRLYTGLFNWTKTGTGLLAYKVSGYDADIKTITQQMEDMNLRLTMKEKQLQSQFSAMETALSSLKNEQSWITSQINSWG